MSAKSHVKRLKRIYEEVGNFQLALLHMNVMLTARVCDAKLPAGAHLQDRLSQD